MDETNTEMAHSCNIDVPFADVTVFKKYHSAISFENVRASVDRESIQDSEFYVLYSWLLHLNDIVLFFVWFFKHLFASDFTGGAQLRARSAHRLCAWCSRPCD